MNYWITTHWPPRVDDDDSEIGTGVCVAEKCRRAANDMRTGDYVAVYETKSGRTEIRELQDGTIIRCPCNPGREGMICYGTIDAAISAIPDSQPQKYADGSEIWWRWYAPVTILSRSGFVNRADVLRILGYNPSYSLRGFGDYHSGLKKIGESEFNALVKAFHASRPIQLPVNASGGKPRNGGEEGTVHLNLKNYVASNPAAALNEPGLRTLGVEYEFPTNDRADIVLVDRHNRIIGVEIEPTISDSDLVGLLQAIKYQHMLECVTGREPGDSRGILVAHLISAPVKVVCAQYGIECIEISREVVDSWATQNAG